jgi:hypothetical protein
LILGSDHREIRFAKLSIRAGIVKSPLELLGRDVYLDSVLWLSAEIKVLPYVHAHEDENHQDYGRAAEQKELGLRIVMPVGGLFFAAAAVAHDEVTQQALRADEGNTANNQNHSENGIHIGTVNRRESREPPRLRHEQPKRNDDKKCHYTRKRQTTGRDPTRAVSLRH